LILIVVVQECFEEILVVEEVLKDPVLAELENGDAFAPLYHVESTGLHTCPLCSHTSSIWRMVDVLLRFDSLGSSGLGFRIVSARAGATSLMASMPLAKPAFRRTTTGVNPIVAATLFAVGVSCLA
jgi:hypothetical protein